MRLLIAFALSRRRETLPHHHISFGLCHQRIPDILLAPMCPVHVALMAQRPDGHIAVSAHELPGGGCGHGSDCVDVHFEFFAVGFEG